MILLVDNYYLLPYSSKYEVNITQLLLNFTKQIDSGDTSEILNLVRSILLIDLSDNKLTRQHFESFLLTAEYEEYTSKWSYQKKEKYYKLFSSIIILHRDSLHIHTGAIQKAKDYLSVNLQAVKTDLIKNVAGDESLVVYANLVSPILELLTRRLDNVKGYKRTYFKWKKNQLKYHLEIEDVNEYFSFTKRLFKEVKKYDDPYPEGFTDEFFDFFNINPFERNSFFNKYKDFIKGRSQKIILAGGEEYLSRRFIKEAQRHLGEFYIYDCSDGEFEISPGESGLIFRNIHKLNPKQINNLCAKLFKGEYKEKPVIMQTNKSIEALGYYDFEKIFLPEYDKVKPLLGRIFFYLAKEKRLLETDLNNQLVKNFACSKQVVSILSRIPSLTGLERILDEDINKNMPLDSLNILVEDFWYDFREFIGYKNNETLAKPEEKEDTDPSKTVTITYDNKDDCWIITSPLLKKELKPFPCSKSSYLMYILYLAKHCKYPKKITEDNLKVAVKDWQYELKKKAKEGKGEEFDKKPKYKSGRVYEYVRSFLTQNGLSKVFENGIFKLDKVYCQYDPDKGEKSIFIKVEAENLPEPRYIIEEND